MVKIYKLLIVILCVCSFTAYADDKLVINKNTNGKMPITTKVQKENEDTVEVKAKVEQSVSEKSKKAVVDGVEITAKNCDKVEPCILVSDVSKKIFTLINGASNDSDVAQLIDNEIVPKFDFDLITQYALGSNWKLTTKDQQTTLVNLFKSLLIYAYSTAVSKLRNAKITITESKLVDTKKAQISTKFLLPDSPSSQSIKIEYDFAKRDNKGGWKVYDVKIEDNSLVSTYREQFTESVQSKGINGLIKELQNKLEAITKNKSQKK